MEHLNHMNGISYFPDDPLTKLELMLYSCFLKEPSFYNPKTDRELTQKDFQSVFSLEKINEMLREFLLFPENEFKSRQRIFYETSMQALDYNFEGALILAQKAREEFFIRKTSCELIAIAASHPNRAKFNEKHPKFFREIVQKVCLIPPDMISVVDSWKSLKGSKESFPSCLQRAFQDILENLTKYHANKYRNACIDAIRLSHPKKTEIIDELMKTGKVVVEEKDATWETHRSNGKNWEETLELLEYKMPHMAALRNLRGVALNVRKQDFLKKYCDMLEKGVKGGKQFPFHYITAYESVMNATKSFQTTKTRKKYYKKGIRKQDLEIIKKSLENCIQISIENHPKLNGNVFVLSDNSGSAWGAVQSEYGTKTVAEIGNLSALITALSCEKEGVIGFFGDSLVEYKVNKNLSLLENYEKMKEIVGKRGTNIGGATEHGIWEFFKRAMKNPQQYHYDHLFCYSDQQAGHGGLFTGDTEMGDEWIWDKNYRNRYIHVPRLIQHYRKTINPRLNVFTIQTAGYNDSILPQNFERGAIMTGWTGKEVVLAEKLIKKWDKYN